MRTMLVSTFVFLLALAGACLAPSASKAEVIYPWCAYYGGSDFGGTNCYFSTYVQCMEALSGNGGYCDVNPAYAPVAPRRGLRGR